MLLKSEVVAGGIYVYDPDFMIGDHEPALYRLMEAPETKIVHRGMFEKPSETETIPLWENINTGELESMGTHCFTTIERIKKMFFNKDSLNKKRRTGYIEKAYTLV